LQKHKALTHDVVWFQIPDVLLFDWLVVELGWLRSPSNYLLIHECQ
jgi:hypothetical protein